MSVRRRSWGLLFACRSCAINFRLDDLLSQGASSIPDDVACTDNSCSWVAPANAAKVQPERLKSVQIYKPVVGKAKPPQSESTLTNFHPAALCITPEKAGELVANLRACNPSCTFVAMFDGQQYLHDQPCVDTANFESAFVEPPLKLSYLDMAPSKEVTVSTFEISDKLKLPTAAQLKLLCLALKHCETLL